MTAKKEKLTAPIDKVRGSLGYAQRLVGQAIHDTAGILPRAEGTQLEIDLIGLASELRDIRRSLPFKDRTWRKI